MADTCADCGGAMPVAWAWGSLSICWSCYIQRRRAEDWSQGRLVPVTDRIEHEKPARVELIMSGVFPAKYV